MLKIKNNIISTSDTNTYYSKPLSMRNSSDGSFHLVWTGSTPVITETVWATNDPSAAGLVGAAGDTGWTDVSALIAAVDVTGNSGSGFVIISGVDGVFDYVRLKFVNGSGTGVITINASTKDYS